MKNEPVYLKLDSRNRISLTKVSKNLSGMYKVHSSEGRIILEPINDIDKEVEWIFKPENKEILEKIKKGLNQKADIDLGSFQQYLDEE